MTYSDKQLLTYAFYMLNQARQDQHTLRGADPWLTDNRTLEAIKARVAEIQKEEEKA